MMIYTIKTVVGRENVVLAAIAAKAKSENLSIQALVHPEELKGYIFVEGDLNDIERAIKGMPHSRGLIKEPVDISAIERFLQPRKAEVELNVGDIIEIIGGPFKGEKGKVTRYDKVKRELTMEPTETPVPIPITVSVEFVKVLQKAK
ncbi:MAG: transcription elongation factor Spt5 [Candidatus Aenigmatarchaeota archaeon]|nr:transcription elongation factor Spt5 [Candidatus Aenigmarchaeota archaeon]